MKVSHPAYSPDLSLYDFCSFGDTERQMKNQVIRDEDHLEDRLIEVWKDFLSDLLWSVFDEWTTGLEDVMAHGGEDCLNQHELIDILDM
jgi:hypothetical protein